MSRMSKGEVSGVFFGSRQKLSLNWRNILPVCMLPFFVLVGCGAAVPPVSPPPSAQEASGTESRQPESRVTKLAVERNPAMECTDYPEVQKASEPAILAMATDGSPTAVAWKPRTTPPPSKSAWHGETRTVEGELTTYDRKGFSARKTEAYRSGHYVVLHEGYSFYSLLLRLEPRKESRRRLGVEFVKPRDDAGAYQAGHFTMGKLIHYVDTYDEATWDFAVSTSTTPMLLVEGLSAESLGAVLVRNSSCARRAVGSAEQRAGREWTGILSDPRLTLFFTTSEDGSAQVAIARTDASSVRVASYRAGVVPGVGGASMAIGDVTSDLYMLLTFEQKDGGILAGTGLISWRDGENGRQKDQIRLVASIDGASWTEAMIEALTSDAPIEEWWSMEDRLYQKRIDQMERGGPSAPP